MRPLSSLRPAILFLSSLALALPCATAQQVAVGLGGYTTVFPGVDVAGRNSYPSGTPQLSGNAVGKPVPTNDWWSALIKLNHAANLFNYPLAMRTLPGGLDVGYIVPPSTPNGSVQPLSDISPVIVGVTGLSATQATVSDYSDWTVTMAWDAGGLGLRATSGMGMPFLYFQKSAGAEARVQVNVGTPSISGEVLLITNSQNGANFAVYAPQGSVWSQAGNVFTSTLNGKDYWSMAMLPPGTPAATAAAAFHAHAFAFPVNTEVSWQYDEETSVVRVDYTITTEPQEGVETRVLQGLLPHQWDYLAADSPQPAGPTYTSIRGPLKMLAGNHFVTERTFKGILPALPLIPDGSDTFDMQALNQKIALLQHEALNPWTDSYNEGQMMNRLVQTARIADLTGNTAARDAMLATVRDRLEDWLRADPGEVAFLFYYNMTWSALIGYPAGHGQDSNLNDHHFHWGYFIHAAAFVEQFQPGWAAGWGGMVDLLVRDAASTDRADPMFPFLRNFSPYAGHSWANGFATFPQGNDQESSSESMQFCSSLIHWGSVTGNRAVRDLGIYLYVTEQTATEEYWFDVHERTLKPEYQFSLVSRIWGNGYDNGTFWTSDIAATYGIELYPIHGGSLYLGHHPAYAEKLWNEMAARTGILSNQVNDNLWHDVYWQFLAFTDPQQAIALYDSYPQRSLKFGISDALTYHWLHAMNALGRVEPSITADHPVAAAFNKNGEITYAGHNYGAEPLLVTFSDGAELLLPARGMATNRDVPVSGALTADFLRAHPGGSVRVQLEVTAGEADRVEYYLDNQYRGESLAPPHVFNITGLQPGLRVASARLYRDGRYSLSNSLVIQVGDQEPYDGSPWAIPGAIEAGKYDRFEGARGQGVAYSDTTTTNNGGFRPEEYVDAALSGAEGATVGWIAGGEWLEYTVEVQPAGVYALSFRFASANPAGGGPLQLLLDGEPVTGLISVPSTGGWATFQSYAVNGLELPEGNHVLRVAFSGGEFNLGRMTFTYTGPLAEERPVARAGGNQRVLLPGTTAALDGTASTVAPGRTALFAWEQVYGPSIVQFSDAEVAAPLVSGLIEGVYRLRLNVSDGTWLAHDEILVVVTADELIPPLVSLTAPVSPYTTALGRSFTVSASASDLDGDVVSVAFYSGRMRIGTAWQPPYSIQWAPPAEGVYTLTAVATDNDGLTAVSEPSLIIADPPVPCRQTAPNGDFSYEFASTDGVNTITFIPEISGVGQPTCLFYYNKTGVNPFPGYSITPGFPFVLNAALGETIHFYFTYSHPAGGERTTFGQTATHVIGECGEAPVPDAGQMLDAWRAAHFPPEVLQDSGLEAAVWGDFADPDADGLLNILELYLNLDPLAAGGSAGAIRLDWLEGGLLERVFTITRLRHLPEGFGRIEWSQDLHDWSAAGLVESVVDTDGSVDDVEARLPGHPAEEPLFFRVLVAP